MLSREWRRLAAMGLLALALTAGGCTAVSTPDGGDGNNAGGDAVPKAPESRPRGVAKVHHVGTASGAETAMEKKYGPGGKRTIFLNGKGGTYKPGWDDSSKNVSSIPSFTAQVPAYEKGAQSWSKLVACVQDQFSRFNVEVTDQDPGNVMHVEAVIGGVPGDVGMEDGVGGVSPMNDDCSMVEKAVVYIFSQVFNGPQVECEVAAQEIGHAIGLDHEYLCSDPMTYLDGCGKKTFQDKTVSCGEYSPRACMCGGKQNSVQFMYDRLGKADPNDPGGGGAGGADPGGGGAGGAGGGDPGGGDASPVVVIVSPADGAKLQENATVTVQAKITDDMAVATAELDWTVGANTMPIDCGSPPEFVTCKVSGSLYTWTFQAGTGPRTFAVRATDKNGNETVSPDRSVTLKDLGQDPNDPNDPNDPPTGGAPQVSVSQPTAGATVSPGETIPVVVEADDDGWVDEVWIHWQSPAGDVEYALEKVGNSTWEIDLDLSVNAPAGDRVITVTAWDDEGQSTTAKAVVIHVSQ